jgi:hypothetical protein
MQGFLESSSFVHGINQMKYMIYILNCDFVYIYVLFKNIIAFLIILKDNVNVALFQTIYVTLFR